MVLMPFLASFNALVNNDGKAPCQFYDLGDLGWVLLKHRKLSALWILTSSARG
jgi:hypothetical protein